MLKRGYHRDKKLRALARGAPCLAWFPWCNGNAETVVWCHSNQSRHGKGGMLKSHDAYGFFGCSACNGPDPRPRSSREAAEDAAMMRTRSYLVTGRFVAGALPADVADEDQWLEGWRSGRIKVA